MRASQEFSLGHRRTPQAPLAARRPAAEASGATSGVALLLSPFDYAGAALVSGAERRCAICWKTLALNGRPKCVPTTSTSMSGFPLRQYRQSTNPSHFVYTAVARTERGHRWPRDCPKLQWQRLEPHSCGTLGRTVRIPPRTSLLSTTSRPCILSPRKGEPRVMTEAIRDGLRTAAARAKMPPRLWPMRCTLRPVSAYARSMVSSKIPARRSGQSAAIPIPE